MDVRRRRVVDLHAVFGALAGIVVAMLLRYTKGPTDNFMMKTVAIVIIMTVFGGFVGLLLTARQK